jgi:hypothetical protein
MKKLTFPPDFNEYSDAQLINKQINIQFELSFWDYKDRKKYKKSYKYQCDMIQAIGIELKIRALKDEFEKILDYWK